jgi:hypothetical protein
MGRHCLASSLGANFGDSCLATHGSLASALPLSADRVGGSSQSMGLMAVMPVRVDLHGCDWGSKGMWLTALGRLSVHRILIVNRVAILCGTTQHQFVKP